MCATAITPAGVSPVQWKQQVFGLLLLFRLLEQEVADIEPAVSSEYIGYAHGFAVLTGQQ